MPPTARVPAGSDADPSEPGSPDLGSPDLDSPGLGAAPSWAALACLVGRSMEGMALLDAGGRTVYVNPAGAEMLGSSTADLAGHRTPFSDLADGTDTTHGDLQVRVRAVPGTDTRTVHFRLRLAVRRQRQVTAFANTAAAIARESTLEVVLDRLAAEVRRATGMTTCAVVLLDGPDEEIRYVGRSGLPPDYVESFEAARRSGAPTVTAEAFRTRRTVVARGTRDRVLADERWAPAHHLLRDVDWDTFIAAPMVVRGRAIGALNGFHGAGRDPDAEDVRFLSVMADHAAIAVENARMFASLQLRAAEHERARLARDLHDSVNQALFSLSLQARGIEIGAVHRADPDLLAQLTELRELAQHALSEMRALIQFRRPTELRDDTLVGGVRRLAGAVTQRTGLPVTVSTPEDILVVDEFLEEDLFRLIQEAVNNVVKHARATRADVVISGGGPGRLVIDVIDDGVGLGPDRRTGQGGIGMATMRERAEHHGAVLEITAGPTGRGTRVRVVVPMPGPGSAERNR